MAGGAAESASRGARVSGWFLAQLLRTLRATVRVRFVDDAQTRAWEASREPFVLAFWHCHLLLMRYAYRGSRIVIMSSQSKDGDLSAQTMRRLGVDVVRGSTSRGGVAALREVVRRARAGWDVGMTPDGPRGPARRVQPGVVFLAAATGLPIVPVAIAARRAWRLRSWDRMIVPKPTSAVVIAYGEPIRIAREDDLEHSAELLRLRLEATDELAERAVGAPPEADGKGDPCPPA